MHRSRLSLASAVISLVGAVIWLAMGNGATGVVWLAISTGWLLVSIAQWGGPEEIEPSPGKRLVRRFSRLLMFWS